MSNSRKHFVDKVVYYVFAFSMSVPIIAIMIFGYRFLFRLSLADWWGPLILVSFITVSTIMVTSAILSLRNYTPPYDAMMRVYPVGLLAILWLFPSIFLIDHIVSKVYSGYVPVQFDSFEMFTGLLVYPTLTTLYLLIRYKLKRRKS